MRTEEELLRERLDEKIRYLEEMIFDCKRRNSSEDVYFKNVFEQTLKELRYERKRRN